MLIRKNNYLLFLIFILSNFIFPFYPEIKKFNNNDPIYKQLQKDVEYNYVHIKSDKKILPLNIFKYQVKKNESIFTISAKVNISYDSIISLNRIENNKTKINNRTILIPNITGLFIPVNPESELEYFMYNLRKSKINDSKRLKIYYNNTKAEYYFFPDFKLEPAERVFFLGILFRFPLEKAKISSFYGKRKNPFSGKMKFHKGVDLAAPEKTPILAANSGKIIKLAYDITYGNSILIEHSGGWQTFYAHLSKVLVEENQKVFSGTIIGEVGSTGMTTGPHLHFEVKREGKSKNPLDFIPNKKE